MNGDVAESSRSSEPEEKPHVTPEEAISGEIDKNELDDPVKQDLQSSEDAEPKPEQEPEPKQETETNEVKTTESLKSSQPNKSPEEFRMSLRKPLQGVEESDSEDTDDDDPDDDDDLDDDDDDDNNDPYCFSEDDGEFSPKRFSNAAGNTTRAGAVAASLKKEMKYDER